MAKWVSRRNALAFGFILVILVALKSMYGLTSSGIEAGRKVVSSPKFPSVVPYYPGGEFPTFKNPVSCNAKARETPQNAPLMVPKDGEWYGCWQGHVETARGSKGATECKNVYNGKKSPPKKYKNSKGAWYGCSFDTNKALWECPSCEATGDSTFYG